MVSKELQFILIIVIVFLKFVVFFFSKSAVLTKSKQSGQTLAVPPNYEFPSHSLPVILQQKLENKAPLKEREKGALIKAIVEDLEVNFNKM